MEDEENQKLLAQNPQDIQRTSYSNWENYEKPVKQEQPSKLDAVVIVLLILLITLAAFGLVKHYQLETPANPVEIEPVKRTHSSVSDVYSKISDAVEKIKEPKTQVEKVVKVEQDEKDIDNVIDQYLSNFPIEQFTNVQEEWDDDVQEVQQFETKVVEDLNNLITTLEDQPEIPKPIIEEEVQKVKEYEFKVVEDLNDLIKSQPEEVTPTLQEDIQELEQFEVEVAKEVNDFTAYNQENITAEEPIVQDLPNEPESINSILNDQNQDQANNQ